MATPTDDRLSFSALARQQGRIERQIAGGVLTRLEAEAPVEGALSVTLSFRMDSLGRPWVTGSAKQLVTATCQGCLVERSHLLEVDFDLCMLPEGPAAQAASERYDVLTVDGDTVTIADIVEDELLLALPERLCEALPCPHAPVGSFPADGAQARVDNNRVDSNRADNNSETSPKAAQNPFGVLAALKRADS